MAGSLRLSDNQTLLHFSSGHIFIFSISFSIVGPTPARVLVLQKYWSDYNSV